MRFLCARVRPVATSLGGNPGIGTPVRHMVPVSDVMADEHPIVCARTVAAEDGRHRYAARSGSTSVLAALHLRFGAPQWRTAEGLRARRRSGLCSTARMTTAVWLRLANSVNGGGIETPARRWSDLSDRPL